MRKFHHVKNLVTSMKPYAGEMCLTILSAFIKQFSVIGSAFLTAYIVGLAMEGQLAGRFGPLLIALIVCILLRALMAFGEMYFGHDVAFRVIRNFRTDLYEKISRIAPAYMMRGNTGKLGQTLVGDVEILEIFLAHTCAGFVVAVVVTVMVMTALFFISPVLAVVMLMAAVLIGMVPYSMKKRAASQGNDVRSRLAESNSVMVEGVQGLREIITLNSRDTYREKAFDKMQQLYSAQHTYGQRKGTEGMLTNAAVGLFTVAVMVIAAALVANGEIVFSMYPVAVMLASAVLAPVLELAGVVQELGLVFAAATRIQTVLTVNPTVEDNGKNSISANCCAVEFKNVQFRYPGQKINSLNGVTFSIQEGENVALVGHSGAGKTTCANLLMRYWDVNSGSIEIGGNDVRSYSLESLRDTISAVQQENYLFHVSVRENIRLGRMNATDAEIEAAAKAANAHEFICALPEGYDTIAGERGYALSGGQRQRIAIARALLRNTPIVIFDEAVSSLDTQNERDIQRMLGQWLKGKTVLTIAHRLSTILSADRIVVLNHGSIAAVGTHSELMENSSVYCELIENQMMKD